MLSLQWVESHCSSYKKIRTGILADVNGDISYLCDSNLFAITLPAEQRFQKLVKKTLAIFLLGLFLFNTSGYYIVFKWNQAIVRSGMREMINSGSFGNDYTIIRICNPLLTKGFRKVNKDEFLYQGRMYDILQEMHTGDTTIYYCINDKKEEKLVSQFNKTRDLISGFGAHEKSKHARAILQHLITIAIVYDQDRPHVFQPVEHKFGLITHQISPAYLIPFSPPPELG